MMICDSGDYNNVATLSDKMGPSQWKNLASKVD